MNKDITSALPLSAMDYIPTPNEDALSITGLVKEHGRI